MSHPNIQLKFNIKLDQQMALEFYNNQKFGGCNFWKERALYNHPELSKIDSAKNPKIFLNNYINEFYKLHRDEIKKLSKKTPIYLNKSQDNFFKIINKIFNNHKWQKKKITGYFSIFDFCPRFLESNSFQIFIYDNKEMQLFTIFHEILHFIFYDFANKKFPNKFKNLNTEKGKFWDIAETFNAVIQDTNEFTKLHGKIKNIGYPDHKDLIKKGKKLWKKNSNIENWIIEMMKD